MRVKGVAVIAEYNYFLKRFGAEAMEKVKNAMQEADRRELFGKKLLPVSWLGFGAYIRFIFTADKVLGKGDSQLVKEAGFYCAQDNFKGIYKFFISLATPKFILNNSDKVWRQYYDQGRVTVEWPSGKHCILKLTEVTDMPVHHEWDQIPTLTEAVRLSGGKNTAISHSKCLARKDDLCQFDITWE